ncbi:MAG: S8 family serine peptidase [Kaiparowitsia implicata GSE-PSE-MK54-09C]|jgi:serine protease|nr:S8 family serine peptidase [Kaiparowitsia implicata GSE-PSE-MK54-09C]
MTPPISSKRLIITLLLGLYFCGGLALAVWRPTIAIAQVDTADLFYRFNGEHIPLVVKENAIAVAFQDQPPSRSVSPTPLYQQLQNDLNAASSRGSGGVTVQPVGTSYAIATLPAGSRSGLRDLRPRLQQPYVETTLAVVSRADQNEQILLPNEIIVSFAANTSASEQQQILAAQGLELIRPLRFTENRVLARLRTLDRETAVLTAAEALNQADGVRSATPNFIPVRSPLDRLDSELTVSERSIAQSTPGNASALAWHLDSAAMASGRNNTGVKAPGAWALGSRGGGVTVAVIDALIQWDHPALVNSIYQLPPGVSGLPGESRGWDFVGNDSETRVEAAELSVLRPLFQSTFTLSDGEFLRQHSAMAADIQRNEPGLSEREIAAAIRRVIRARVAGEFHGTTVSGVVGAAGTDHSRLIGVAPEATLLPVRVCALFRGCPSVNIVEGIGYAAVRGADIINLSLGGIMPSTETADVITEVLAAHPNLIIVAASGNSDIDRVGFPAGLRDVISVGASTRQGTRASYSNYGPGLTLMAPGGDMRAGLEGGILSTSGTGSDLFWQGITTPAQPWPPAQDPRGNYVWTQGTSFASPAVAGVVALMLSADPERRLNRDRIIALLEAASSHAALTLTPQERELYRVLRDRSATPPTENELHYFLGSGLVDAEQAVRLVQASVK